MERNDRQTPLERALRLLGPLEARIMREVWTGTVSSPFTVHDMQGRMPELAYTTVMTTLHRLTEKGMLAVEQVPGRRAYVYRAMTDPDGYLCRATRRQVEALVERFGEVAVAAFAEHIQQLSPEQRKRLREVGER